MQVKKGQTKRQEERTRKSMLKITMYDEHKVEYTQGSVLNMQNSVQHFRSNEK